MNFLLFYLIAALALAGVDDFIALAPVLVPEIDRADGRLHVVGHGADHGLEKVVDARALLKERAEFVVIADETDVLGHGRLLKPYHAPLRKAIRMDLTFCERPLLCALRLPDGVTVAQQTLTLLV